MSKVFSSVVVGHPSGEVRGGGEGRVSFPDHPINDAMTQGTKISLEKAPDFHSRGCFFGHGGQYCVTSARSRPGTPDR